MIHVDLNWLRIGWLGGISINRDHAKRFDWYVDVGKGAFYNYLAYTFRSVVFVTNMLPK
jgi:hypothetical protein